MEYLVYYAAIHALFRTSHAMLRKIHDRFGADIAEEWHRFPKSELLTFVKPEKKADVLERWSKWDMEQFAHKIGLLKVRLLFEDDPLFPSVFKETKPRPFLLYCRGSVSLLASQSIAVVGARKMSTYAEQLLQFSIPLLVQAGFVTVSGGAAGVDTLAHETTMECGGNTIAVLGTGIDVAYPHSNRNLFTKMAEGEHLLLSEFALSATPEPFNFPLRNRLVAALAQGVLVAEAKESSGALITASIALDLGKEVYSFVGNVFNTNLRGNHLLVEKGEANPVVSPQHLLQLLGCEFSTSAKDKLAVLSEKEAVFLRLFTATPVEQDSLMERSRMSIVDFQLQLTLMELKGYIRKVEGTKWIASL